MQRIPLQFAKPGMVLAEPLLRDDGIPLVGAGFELTDAVIERFRQMGVAVIVVAGNGPGRSVELARIASELPRLFRRQRANPFMMGLQGILSKHYARKIAELKAAEEEAKLAEQALAQADAAPAGESDQEKL